MFWDVTEKSEKKWKKITIVQRIQNNKEKNSLLWDIKHVGPFCVRIAFDRAVGGYIAKVYRLSHLSHVVNVSFIIGRVKFEADLSIEGRSQLINFGKISYSDL